MCCRSDGKDYVIFLVFHICRDGKGFSYLFD